MVDVNKIIEKFLLLEDLFHVGVVGYSSQKFDEKKAEELLKNEFEKLKQSGKNISIVSGLTDLGIPKIAYKLAKQFGFFTVGIACEKAYEYDCFPVDKKIIIGEDWGDESQTFLKQIEMLIRIGGGKQSLAEVEEAKKKGVTIIEYELESEKN